jgi:hypothetical protein
MRLYHVSPYDVKDNILSSGILTKYNVDNAVYLTSDYVDLLITDVEQRSDRVCIFEVDITGMESYLQPDEEFDSYEGVWCWYICQNIDPNRISLHSIVSCTQRATGVHIQEES